MHGASPDPSASPHNPAKISPDASESVPAFGLGRFAPFDVVRYIDRSEVRIHWSRTLGWLAGLAVVAWLVAGSVLFGFVKYRRGFSEVQFSHMLLLPWKLDEYRRAKGEFLIREGLAKADAQEWRAAFDLLRGGLVAVPEHREARLLVARIYLMAGRADMTRTVLLEGLRFHRDQLDYLRTVLGYFFELQADDTVISITRELSPQLDPRTPAARMVSTALAYAYFNRSRHDESQATLARDGLLATPEGRFVVARIAWERGRRAEALDSLRELTTQVPSDVEIYRTLARCLREDGRIAELRRASIQYQLAQPDRPDGYLDFIATCADEGDHASQTGAENSYLARFADNSAALLRLAELAAASARPDLAERVQARCRQLGRDEPEATLQLMAAQLSARDYAAVVEQHADSRWPERARLVAEALRGVALAAEGRPLDGQSAIRRLSETRIVPAQVLTAMAVRLQDIGQVAEARRLVAHACEVDPLYLPALVLRLRAALDDDSLESAAPLIERLLGMRKPPPDLVDQLRRALESDLHLFVPRRVALIRRLTEFLALVGKPSN